jgi:23S rRNA pseudouridine1911/1915/1917 synthase
MATRDSGEPPSSEHMDLDVPVDDAGCRLDQFLATRLGGRTRSQIQRLIREGRVGLDRTAARPGVAVRAGDVVRVDIPAPAPATPSPEALALDILYDDADLVVVDKPAGMVVHPAAGHANGTLVNALLHHVQDLSGIGGELRPGIVHRLDLNTSGLMVVAKTQQTHQRLTEQMKNREILKEYRAISVGLATPDSGTIDAPIGRDPRHRQRMAVDAGGRAARTHYETLEELPGHTLLNLVLETGRTHQIRVHLAYLGYPLLGDGVYGNASTLTDRQFLHAARLGFRHPVTGAWMEHCADLPGDLSPALAALRG